MSLCVFLTSIFAYLVTKKEMIGRKFVYRFVIITMYMGAGLIPWYLTMKAYGLRNSFLVYILPSMVNAFFLILIKTNIESLPASLEESAAIDGSGFFSTYFKIIFPLSKPILATVAVFSAVGHWNTWQDNFFLVTTSKLQTIQLIMLSYLRQAQSLANSMKFGTTAQASGVFITMSPESIRMTIVVVSTLPILLVYPFFQRYFTKGIMMGAVKG